MLLLVCYTNEERDSYKYTSVSMLMQKFCLNTINPINMHLFGAFDAVMPICVVLPKIQAVLPNTHQQLL